VFVLWPSSLRFHPNCPRPKDKEGNFLAPLPAMVALVEHVGRGPVAVHCTYLRPDGSAKAELPKKQQRCFFGPVAGGAVRFGAPRFGQWLAVAEGLETALSVAVACSMPAWAALCAEGIRKLVLPPRGLACHPLRRPRRQRHRRARRSRCGRTMEGGMSGRNEQRKLGTTRGSPRRSRTAKASRISR
jgi:hypothetical protein